MSEKIAHQVAVIEKYLKKPENKYCADCKRPSPSWASINLGVFVCIKCSGCHREIGVHITKIKSINLDLWQPTALGNFGKITNNYWEYKLQKDFNFDKIRNDDFRLQDFIRDKYERKRFADTKKIDPMTLINQGYDISKDNDISSNNGSAAWEDEEEIPRDKIYIKPKQGKSFGIVSRPGEKKQIQNQNPETHNVQFNAQMNNQQANTVSGGSLLNFNDVTPVNSTNASSGLDLFQQSSENIPANANKQSSGFSFIKKKNKLPESGVNLIPIAEPQTGNFLPINEPSIQPINSKNDNLIELFSVQIQQPKDVQDLTNGIMKAYQETEDKTKNSGSQIKINMNHPNININNYYDYGKQPYNANQNMMPMQMPMSMPMAQPYLYQTPYQMNPTPYANHPSQQGTPFYQSQPITQPYVLDLYNPPKNEKIHPEQPPAFIYNANYQESLNPKKNNDPFKNLVSFN